MTDINPRLRVQTKRVLLVLALALLSPLRAQAAEDSSHPAVSQPTADRLPEEAVAAVEQRREHLDEAVVPPAQPAGASAPVPPLTPEELERRNQAELALMDQLKSHTQANERAYSHGPSAPGDASSQGITDLPTSGQFTVSGTPVTFRIPSSVKSEEVILLRVTGEAELWISFVLDGSFVQKSAHRLVKSTSESVPETVPVSLGFFKSRPTEISFYTRSMVSPIRVHTMVVAALDILFNDSMKVWCFYVSELHFVVRVPAKTKAGAPNRLQFIVDSNLGDKRLTGRESLDLLVNLSGDFPTTARHDARASGHLAFGLIKTLSAGSPLFCDKSTCEYRVTVAVSGLDFVTFFPSILENGARIDFSENMSLLEELEPGEVVRYELGVDMADSSMLFSVLPLEGAVGLYLNPDSGSGNVEEFRFRSKSARRKQILVTRQEARQLGFPGRRFFVIFKNPSATSAVTFKFSALRLGPAEAVPLQENHSHEGVVVRNEVVSYTLDLKGGVSETVKVVFSLKQREGKAGLFVKECLPQEQLCAVTRADVGQTAMADRIFRFSAEDFDEGERARQPRFVDLTFNCAGKTLLAGTFDSARFPLSHSCRFAVGVTALPSEESASYQLTTFGEGLLTDIFPTGTHLVKLNPKDKARFRICLADHPGVGTKDVFFKLSIVSGRFLVSMKTFAR